jgi:hypothetical protein
MVNEPLISVKCGSVDVPRGPLPLRDELVHFSRQYPIRGPIIPRKHGLDGANQWQPTGRRLLQQAVH